MVAERIPQEPIASRADAPAPRVLLVDDQPLFRRGIRALLESHGLHVVGEAGNGRHGVQCARELCPDVVVMDLRMPEMGGIEATRQLLEHAPDARVLVATASSDESDVLEALLAGACGYVLKAAPVDEIVASVRAAASGESFISPEVAAQLLRRLRDDGASPARTGDRDPRLSDDEIEVLRLLARGQENNEIAAALFMSTATVKRHVSTILEKLQLHNRTQAAVYAARHDLI